MNFSDSEGRIIPEDELIEVVKHFNNCACFGLKINLAISANPLEDFTQNVLEFLCLN